MAVKERKIEMFKFDEYAGMRRELNAANDKKIVLYLPRDESEGPLCIAFNTPWVKKLEVPLYIGPGRPSQWPSFNCEPMYENSNATKLGYQVGSLSCLARVIAARFIGNDCRVEWLNKWACFPDDTNYLNVCEKNIFFQTREDYDHETYEEYSLEQLKDKWMKEQGII